MPGELYEFAYELPFIGSAFDTKVTPIGRSFLGAHIAAAEEKKAKSAGASLCSARRKTNNS